ncbi:MAG: hypothetical protein E4H16_00165 [Candidatus Atribacteria bacterium]|nr:MAG: hypothetical protein E4H16_00165 [Candidatus Atribacteria bacterium]
MNRLRNRVIKTAIAVLALMILVKAADSVEYLAQEKIVMEVMYLPSVECMKMISLGYRNLSSDLLWFKAVQYYGGYVLAQNGIRLFSHLIELITELDPNFIGAYKLSALVITEDLDQYNEGVRLMEKGVRNNPEDFWLTYELGFIHYINGRNYEEAQRWFELAALLPNADERAARFAASAAAKGGNYEDGIELWKDLAENSENKHIRELAERYIDKLKMKIENKNTTGKSMSGT